MAFAITALWRAPNVNPVNLKAESIPAFNPINMYGRVFFFSWFGFMIAFWSWYAFPPLLSDIIANDLHLNRTEIDNSNIIALVATLLVRIIAGPCCDRFGPRRTFAGCLLAGAVPTFLAGTVFNAPSLLALRFFIGILGGCFVPCQVWSTVFFDKRVVGTANALTAGFGNAGGGITYFAMPAIYNSLVSDGISKHVAWRVAFVVPGILIVSTAISLLVLCPDCPTGKWSERESAADSNLRNHGISCAIVSVPAEANQTNSYHNDSTRSNDTSDKEKEENHHYSDNEVHISAELMNQAAKGEVIQKPSLKEAANVVFSFQTLVTCACYFCTFGAELSINNILGDYYHKNFPKLSLQEYGNWASMFALLNFVTRPLGGFMGDLVYRKTGSVLLGKKIPLHICSVMGGIFLIIIGKMNSHKKPTMFGLIAGAAFFLEGANGLNFAYVPHVHPFANGIISGITSAAGNFGGIIFAIIFRYSGTDYAKCFWIIGTISICINAAVCWVKPIPRGQIGGH
jgi:NNP family nitrate/nitrite transporter-like MFS transporter